MTVEELKARQKEFGEAASKEQKAHGYTETWDHYCYLCDCLSWLIMDMREGKGHDKPEFYVSKEGKENGQPGSGKTI